MEDKNLENDEGGLEVDDLAEMASNKEERGFTRESQDIVIDRNQGKMRTKKVKRV